MKKLKETEEERLAKFKITCINLIRVTKDLELAIVGCVCQIMCPSSQC